MKELYYGVAYYHEYLPYDRLTQDIDMMKAAGINTVRIAESTWSTMEPQSGVYDFSHIDVVLNAMHEADIHVIIGTPTYAVPTWMVKEHPDVLATTPQGPNKYGPRQNMDITNPVYLFHAERAIRAMMTHIKDHPAIIGYQLDNETKHYNTSGPNVQHAFIKHMRNKFPNLDDLNHHYGLDYWSNRINSWEDFPNVDNSINGSLTSEFATFQRLLVTKFLDWQSQIVREYKKDHQFITHNFDFDWKGSSYGIQPDVDHFEAARTLDVAGVDIYHPSQDELTGCEIAFCGDIARSMKRNNYFVLETEAQAFITWTPYPGQLRLQAFSHLASGANMVAYWHWSSLHNACETYWKGLLSHDFEANPTYKEAMTIGAAFSRLGNKLINLKKKNKVALLFSNESLTAIKTFSMFQGGLDYNDIVRRLYDSLYKLNVECDFIDPSSDTLMEYDMVVVPSLYSASDELLTSLNEFVEKGGHAVYMMRSGFANEHVKVRTSHQPGIIEQSAGVYYSQFVAGKHVSLKDHSYDVPSEATAIDSIIELVSPTTAKVLATYDHPYWGQYAAVTQNDYGTGSATYIGCLPSEPLMMEILKQVLAKANLWGTDQSLAFPIITKWGVNDDDHVIRYFFNYSMDTVTFEYPHLDGKELLTESKIRKGDPIQLTPWNFAIIEENIIR